MTDMTTGTDQPDCKVSRREARAERLAAALKANLRRRKALADRGRTADGQETGEPAKSDKLHQAAPMRQNQPAEV